MALPSRSVDPPAPQPTSSPGPPPAMALPSILLAFFSVTLLLLIIPPMFWHARNRNIGATALIAWLIVLLFFNFINAILWHNDDSNSWYNGVGLCDFEVRVQVASQVALPACFACILRALATVLHTSSVTFMPTQAQRRRSAIIDIVCCVGFPLLQVPLHLIVQSARYYIYGISGCFPLVSGSWLSVLLMAVPPLVWVLIDAYFAVLIIIRLYRYRLSFNAILASSNTTKSRFLRLYLICVLYILAAVPVGFYVLYVNVTRDSGSFNWKKVHSTSWTVIIMVKTHGIITYDRWIWLTVSFMVFIFFGLGKDAITMYRTGLLAMGMGKVIPSLKSEHRSSSTGTVSSFGSRARMLFKRKSAASSASTLISEEKSPKKTTFLGTISEEPGTIGIVVQREMRHGSEHELVGLPKSFEM